MPDYILSPGTAPLLVSLPHDGTALPAHLQARLSAVARRVPDTDWHVARLYEFARSLGASVLVPHWSRYVADLNRDPAGHALYPGRSETGLVPTTTFAGEPIYAAGAVPDAAEIVARRERYWAPYHAALAAELARLRARHPRVVLWDGHSIRSRVPRFFAGRLPDLNLGTAGGASCSPELQARLTATLETRADGAAGHYSHVVNGRFKGGYITRHYGQPTTGIEAVQLEMVQCIYMDEDSFAYVPERAAPVVDVIRALLEACLAHAG